LSDTEGFSVAILIVGFRNALDISACLTALSRATAAPSFDVFICENGGIESFQELYALLIAPQGPCDPVSDDLLNSLSAPSDRLVDVRCLALKGRRSRVWIGHAAKNLGYAGGINVWVERLLRMPGWQGLWILNPDAEPEAGALQALVQRAVTGNKGMVGSTILPFDDRAHVHCRAGHHWRKLITNLASFGRGEPVDGPIDLQSIEAGLDCVSGASMYVTRLCLEKIGPMDERFFLYYEDADWSFRAKSQGLGYASASLVPHKGGTTIGSAGRRGERSRLSVYLESRNRIVFVRKHMRRSLPLASLMGLLFATEYFLVGSLLNFGAALGGLVAGLKGETGPPPNSFMESVAGPDSKKKKAKVMIVTTRWWPPAARVAAVLAKLGFQVAAISPPDAVIRHLGSVRQYYYRPWAGSNSVARAIKAWRPDFLICADDGAVNDLHGLHRLASLTGRRANTALVNLIETSLGDPASYDIVRAKSNLIPHAISLGVRCPQTSVIFDNRSCETAISTVTYPILVKADGSWGGVGVRLANSENEARTAIRELARQVDWKFDPVNFFRGHIRSQKIINRIGLGRRTVSLQRYIAGRSANRAVACYRGKVLAGISVEALECLNEFGPATIIRVIDHPEMKSSADTLVERLGLSGFVGFDFVLDSANQAWLVEMNPRLTPTGHFLLKNDGNFAQPRNAPECDHPFEAAHAPGTTLALFPQELLRSRRSNYLRAYLHDVPWDEPEFIRSCLDSVVGLGVLKRLRRRIGI
jgi:N-acetylglucosaminyl-diphospho-decaprenol L-rhamnosyltransferase